MMYATTLTPVTPKYGSRCYHNCHVHLIRDRHIDPPGPGSALAFAWGLGNLSLLMSTLSQEHILNALKAVKYPGYSRDIISFGLIKQVTAHEGAVSVSMQLTSANAEAGQQIKAESERILKALPGVTHVHVEVKQPAAAPGAPAGPSPWANQNRVPGIKRIVAVASGKGGVGKSTLSVNLACALAHLGARVGLLDCDIYGPSIPLMMGINQRPSLSEAERMIPPTNHGVKLMSMGFLLNDDQPVIWRGPMTG
jgi:ATP-binding protein involved in chromosome partitioning